MQVLKDEILLQYKLGTEQDGIILRYVQSVDAQGINDSRIPVAGNGNYWCARRDSNSQPSDPKSDALSIELRTLVNYSVTVAVLGARGGFRRRR